jgi:antitoxin VapB
MPKTTAKLFMHGRSQAVRLPKEFRMEGKEVEITKSGNVVTLRPIPADTVDWKTIFAELDALGPLDDDFMRERYQDTPSPRETNLDE